MLFVRPNIRYAFQSGRTVQKEYVKSSLQWGLETLISASYSVKQEYEETDLVRSVSLNAIASAG